jgi:hypothetical protein
MILSTIWNEKQRASSSQALVNNSECKATSKSLDKQQNLLLFLKQINFLQTIMVDYHDYSALKHTLCSCRMTLHYSRPTAVL